MSLLSESSATDDVRSVDIEAVFIDRWRLFIIKSGIVASLSG
ncbi:hypothetical protein [Shewanella sp. 0m-4]